VTDLFTTPRHKLSKVFVQRSSFVSEESADIVRSGSERSIYMEIHRFVPARTGRPPRRFQTPLRNPTSLQGIKAIESFWASFRPAPTVRTVCPDSHRPISGNCRHDLPLSVCSSRHSPLLLFLPPRPRPSLDLPLWPIHPAVPRPMPPPRVDGHGK